jgi:tRNA(Ile2) C34 agmatinyltransferase TiaS
LSTKKRIKTKKKNIKNIMSTRDSKCPECGVKMNSVWICLGGKHYICSEDCHDKHICDNIKIINNIKEGEKENESGAFCG